MLGEGIEVEKRPPPIIVIIIIIIEIKVPLTIKLTHAGLSTLCFLRESIVKCLFFIFNLYVKFEAGRIFPPLIWRSFRDLIGTTIEGTVIIESCDVQVLFEIGLELIVGILQPINKIRIQQAIQFIRHHAQEVWKD
jgi:hypothetical protein